MCARWLAKNTLHGVWLGQCYPCPWTEVLPMSLDGTEQRAEARRLHESEKALAIGRTEIGRQIAQRIAKDLHDRAAVGHRQPRVFGARVAPREDLAHAAEDRLPHVARQRAKRRGVDHVAARIPQQTTF